MKVRKRSIALVTALLLGVIAVFVYLHRQTSSEHQRTTKPTIALVNEDIPSDFNGQSYHFGKNFVDAVANDTEYNWQVVSRSVAEKAYADESVDAVIYLPQEFSQNVLTLQEISPVQTAIEYKILPTMDKEDAVVLNAKAVDIIYEFNQSVVKMYYASIANNISEAESYINNIVGKEEQLTTQLTTQIHAPLNTTFPNYAALLAGTSSLKTTNEANVASQKSFTETTVKLLEETEKSISAQLPDLEKYAALQQLITETNVATANNSLHHQATAHEQVYKGQFDALNNTILNRLKQLHSVQDSTSPLFESLKTKITDYNNLVNAEKGKIATQVASLKEQRTQLLNLEKELYQSFFALEVEPTEAQFDFQANQNQEAAKTALANKLQQSFGRVDNLTTSPYFGQLQRLIGSLSVTVEDYKFDQLVQLGALNEAARREYEADLQLIRQYAAAYEIQPGTLSVADIPAEEIAPQSMSQKVRVVVPAQTEYESSILPIEVTVQTVDGNPFSPADQTQPRIHLDNTSNNRDKIFLIQLSVDVTQNSNYELDLAWNNKTTSELVHRTDSTFQIIPKDPKTAAYKHVGVDTFQALTALLSQIDYTANLIVTLYGGPFDSSWSMAHIVDKKGFEERNASSIFSLYGNMTAATFEVRISDEDALSYFNTGKTTIEKVTSTITSLNTSIEKLEAVSQALSDNLPTDYFDTQLSDLTTWHTETVAQIDKEYQNWKKAAVSDLEIKEWPGSVSSAEKTALYVDKGTTLYDRFTTLIQSTSQTAGSVAKSSQEVRDSSRDFDALSESTASIQKEAETILTSTNELTTTSQVYLTENQEYSANFGSVLANTRTPGVDTNRLYGFFASPIVATNVTTQGEHSISSFDYRWLLLFVAGLLSGGLIVLIFIKWQSRDTK